MADTFPTIAEAARLIKCRERSPVDLVEALLARISGRP
jgi:Asp-tRNA(Asn)/Glu-tRNA(Gln) amidotransferase A subunit family amidase